MSFTQIKEIFHVYSRWVSLTSCYPSFLDKRSFLDTPWTRYEKDLCAFFYNRATNSVFLFVFCRFRFLVWMHREVCTKNLYCVTVKLRKSNGLAFFRNSYKSTTKHMDMKEKYLFCILIYINHIPLIPITFFGFWVIFEILNPNEIKSEANINFHHFLVLWNLLRPSVCLSVRNKNSHTSRHYFS